MTVQILRKCFSFLLNLTTGAKIYVFHSYKGDVFILFCAVFELRYVDLVRGRFRQVLTYIERSYLGSYNK